MHFWSHHCKLEVPTHRSEHTAMTFDRVRHPLERVTRYGALTEHGGRRQIQRPRRGSWIEGTATRVLCANRRSPNRTPIRLARLAGTTRSRPRSNWRRSNSRSSCPSDGRDGAQPCEGATTPESAARTMTHRSTVHSASGTIDQGQIARHKAVVRGRLQRVGSSRQSRLVPVQRSCFGVATKRSAQRIAPTHWLQLRRSGILAAIGSRGEW